MGHGSAGGRLYLSDNKPIKISTDIVNQFDGGNCPALSGKPKIFLFQACRDGEENEEKETLEEAGGRRQGGGGEVSSIVQQSYSSSSFRLYFIV